MVWESERMSGIVNCMIILAQIILLSFDPPKDDQICMEPYQRLVIEITLVVGDVKCKNVFYFKMAMWFPIDMTNTPRFYQADNNQPLDLIPAWLILRMIRSGVSPCIFAHMLFSIFTHLFYQIDRLVDAALVNVDPPKLLLFVQVIWKKGF